MFKRNLIVLGACAAMALAMAGGASAQVTGVVVDRTVNISSLHNGAPSNLFSFNGSVQDQAVQYNLTTDYLTSGSNYQVSTHVDNDAGYIAFANNASSLGTRSSVTTSTTIAVSFKNGTDNAVNASLNSTISPAGFGLYQADMSANPAGDINQHPETPYGLPIGYGNGYNNVPKEVFGEVGVSFQIIKLDSLGGQTVLADFSASLNAYRTGGDIGSPEGPFFELTQTSSTGLTLKNFGLIAADNELKATGYRWDATQVPLSLGQLAAHDTATLLYKTIVTAVTNQQNFYTNADALMAYAGFGDPIGGDAGANGIADPDFPLLQLGLPHFDPVTGKFTGLNFTGYTDPLPLTISDGVNTLNTLQNTIPDRLANPYLGGSAEPEPATWVMLLGGFGLVGAALRRRARPQLA